MHFICCLPFCPSMLVDENFSNEQYRIHSQLINVSFLDLNFNDDFEQISLDEIQSEIVSFHLEFCFYRSIQ